MEAIRAARGPQLRCKGWRQEALLRLLENVLENGENPKELVVYAALGKAARNRGSYQAIVEALKNLEEDETLVIQSGKPIGIFKTHAYAPLVVMANCNLVGKWANSENFYELQEKGLIAWGGLTAGAWQYIGSQGVIQGTYEIFATIARKYFHGSLAGRFILTAGLGGMGGAQPLAGVMANAAILCVEVDEDRIDRRIETGYLQKKTHSLDEALQWIEQAKRDKKSLSVGLVGNAAQVYPEILKRGIIPDIVTDQTSAHDLVYGYIPENYTIEEVHEARKLNPKKLAADARKSIAKEVRAMLEFKRRGAIVFDNGNNIRTQASQEGVHDAFEIDIFTEAFLRPLFSRAIGPFRWIALSGDPEDIYKIDDYILEHFPDNEIATNWIRLAKEYVPFQGLPARIGWFGHGDRTKLATAVNEMVQKGQLSGPIAFTRDHLDAASMAHPNIMTERMKDGSDAIADWPLLNAMLNCSSMADLVAIHSGGGGYTGYMTSAGVTIVADGTEQASIRLNLTLDNDTGLGVLRYADAGYEEALDEVEKKGLRRIDIK
ncbi:MULTISPECIES: urocanate hydratase [Aeribacillus]|jgi:urocanate hydratase|uniref:urocanate hydratase n=1 Tax=Aeribacillus TaxID=1055323 RepID=UPI001022A2DF|nr:MULTISPECIES: urocanate hydratase [Aeribacillus]MED0701409.1 urocanate hydratase [Aeribacillus composti]RZI51580.1 urocanate hydratase [Aeribacillus pallidus]